MSALMKILHVVAVVMVLGNLIMAPFWRKRMARDLQARVAANHSVRVADLLFTLPGWVIVLVTGVVLSFERGWRGGWLHFSLLLFVVWLVVWHMGTLRARKTMLAKTDEMATSGQTSAELSRYERQWGQWSYISAVIAVLILILMVAQPF